MQETYTLRFFFFLSAVIVTISAKILYGIWYYVMAYFEMKLLEKKTEVLNIPLYYFTEQILETKENKNV